MPCEARLIDENEIDKRHDDDRYHHGYPNRVTGGAIIWFVNRFRRRRRIFLVGGVVVFRRWLAVLIRSVTVRFHSINLWCCLGNNLPNRLFGFSD